MSQNMETVRAHFMKLRPEIERIYTGIWAAPELPMIEREGARLMTEWLRGHGFKVRTNAGGLPTAFFAEYGSGGPSIGLLAEYDALPGLANEAVPHRSPLALPAGHGCGHNLIAGSNAGAAIAARYAMEELGLEGRLVVVGTPAEEIVWGKVALLAAGVFDSLDALLTSHVDYQTGSLSRPCLAMCHGEFHYSGISSHSGALRRHNALETAELAVQTYERLRAHNFKDAQVTHVIRRGGLMPGITPDHTQLWVYVRHEDIHRAVEVYEFIKKIARNAAEITDVGFSETYLSASSGYLPNDTLAKLLHRNMLTVGPPDLDDEDMQWMKQLATNCGTESDFTIDTEIRMHTEGVDPYGQDDGEASWRIPLGRINWAQPCQVPLHHWATTALSGSRAGYKGAFKASETIALTSVDLLSQPTVIKAAKEELQQRTGGKKLLDPNVGNFDQFTNQPSDFWDR
jgi:aminobenzoyl-glutamate utilization protein B